MNLTNNRTRPNFNNDSSIIKIFPRYTFIKIRVVYFDCPGIPAVPRGHPHFPYIVNREYNIDVKKRCYINHQNNL